MVCDIFIYQIKKLMHKFKGYKDIFLVHMLYYILFDVYLENIFFYVLRYHISRALITTYMTEQEISM